MSFTLFLLTGDEQENAIPASPLLSLKAQLLERALVTGLLRFVFSGGRDVVAQSSVITRKGNAKDEKPTD
jgi:hypothetical protein